MTSIGELQKKVKTLTEIETKLWISFKTTEKNHPIPTLNIIKAHKAARGFLKTGELKLVRYYPLLALLTFISALLSLFYPAFFIIYIITLGLAMISIDQYRSAITRHTLRDSNFVLHGFGVNDLSLNIFGILNNANSDGSKITKSDIGSILKIVKSRQENDDVSLGFAEHLKKLIYASLFTVPIAAISNFSQLPQYFDKAYEIFNKNIYVSIYLIALTVCIIWIAYDLIFNQTKRKKQQKRYLLLLNIIHESWS